jgi:CheY-like chemotaxis protein
VHRNRTFLVVDDSESDQFLIEMALRKSGVTGPIRAVYDGSEAIAYLMGEEKYSDREEYPFPSFAIIDLNMPKVDGFAVLEHILKNPEWPVIPRVVFTASRDPDDIKKSYMLGASSYHVKPITLQGLCEQLKILYDYWMTCVIPEADASGRQLITRSKGKLGERFPQPGGATQTKC